MPDDKTPIIKMSEMCTKIITMLQKMEGDELTKAGACKIASEAFTQEVSRQSLIMTLNRVLNS